MWFIGVQENDFRAGNYCEEQRFCGVVVPGGRLLLQGKLTRLMMKKSRLLRLGVAVIGGAAGFAYYYYIGCVSGSCAITSNPWISTAYGALIGWLAGPRKAATDSSNQRRDLKS